MRSQFVISSSDMIKRWCAGLYNVRYAMLFCLLLHSTTNVAAAQKAVPEISNLISSLQTYWLQQPPISFSYKYGSSGTAPGLEYESQGKGGFQGGKFYFDGEMTKCDGARGLLDKTYYLSYDGNKFQKMFHTDKVIVSSSFASLGKEAKSIVFELAPLQQFLFALGVDKSYDISALSHVDLWRSLAEKITDIRFSNESGKEFVQLTVTYGDGRIFTVSLDPDQGFYPVIVRLTNGRIHAESKVVKMKQFSIGGKDVFVPLEIDSVTTWPNNHPSTTFKFSVDEATLSVGKELRPELFAPAASRIKSIYDRDVEAYIKREP